MTYGQATYFEAADLSDSITGGACINEISVYVELGASYETGAVLTIDWGDGNTQTETYTGWGPDWLEFIYQHDYTLPGIYSVSFTLFSGTANAYVGSPVTFDMEGGNITSCGHISISTYQLAPNVDYPNAIYDFTGADGLTTTISMNSTYYTYNGLDPTNVPYIVSINDEWLTASGLLQASPDFTIASFEPTGLANPDQISMEVTCSTPPGNPDFDIAYLTDSGFIAASQTGSIWINLCDRACSDTSDATLSVEFPVGLTPDITGLTNPSVTGNILTFDVISWTNCDVITIPFTFPGGTPAGTVFQFVVAVNHPSDTYPGNNTDTLYSWVFNSLDPNDKSVNAHQQIDPSVTEELQYTIRFQNDGNYDAFNVVIVDTLDMHLDLSTFTMAGAKHGVAASVNPTTRVVTFTFSNIMLPPSSADLEASQGYVVYKIREIAGLGEGDAIENTAYIYFDFNPAIVTNTTYNLNTALAVSELTYETIVLYPNPAADAVRFSGADVLSAKVYDLAGKLISEGAVNGNELSVAGLSNGIYQVMIETANGVQLQKLTVKK